MRKWRFLGLAVGPIAIYAGCSSTPPTSSVSGPANLAGSWFDSTDFGQVNLLTISQQGANVVVISPAYYQPFSWGGVNWWEREGQPDTATGTVTGDTLVLCDAAVGLPCPNEIAYLSNGLLVFSLDSVDISYFHSLWSTADTIPPASAPAAVELPGVWLSDSVGRSCPGIAQIGLVVGLPVNSGESIFQMNEPLYESQGWTRQCGETTWNSRGLGWQDETEYIGSLTSFPCSPADNCYVYFVDADSVQVTLNGWFFLANSSTVLIDESSGINGGPLPDDFVLDGDLTSLTNLAGSAPRARMPMSRREALLLRLKILKQARTRGALERRPFAQRIR
jgi:hypothetical protein